MRLRSPWQIIITFYAIATQVDSVYEVVLPAAVKQLITSFSVVVSFGISYTSPSLECLGLHGYLSTLLFCTRSTALTRLPCAPIT